MGNMWHYVGVAAGTALVVYAAFVAFFFFGQHRLLYYPGRNIDATPESAGIPFEDLSLRTADGETLNAWYIPAPDPPFTLLYCHGNAGDLGDRVDIVRAYRAMGLALLIFDYRGFGRSTGKPSEQGTYLDAQAGWEHLVNARGVPPSRIILVGQSLGGSIAAWLAARQAPAALVLESAFTSIPDVGSWHYPYLPVRLLARYRYDTLSRMPAIRCPILIAHSRADTTVPFEHSRRLAAKAAGPVTSVELTADPHMAGIDTDPPYRDTFRRFIDKL